MYYFYFILIFFLTVTSLFFSVPVTVYNVYTCKTPKQPNLWESFRPLVSLVLLFTVTTIWALGSPNKVLDAEPRTFYYIVGTVFSNIAVGFLLFLLIVYLMHFYLLNSVV